MSDKAPCLWHLEDLLKQSTTVSREVDGKYIPARPLGFMSLGNRIRLAWMVFTGKADAVIWPGGQ